MSGIFVRGTARDGMEKHQSVMTKWPIAIDEAIEKNDKKSPHPSDGVFIIARI